jgi:hypothetical protein
VQARLRVVTRDGESTTELGMVRDERPKTCLAHIDSHSVEPFVEGKHDLAVCRANQREHSNQSCLNHSAMGAG